MLNRRLEEAALNAWPALQQILVDGWVLRFSQGYTKRANSVQALFQSSEDIQQKIELCEKLYAAKQLPAIFRLTPESSPPELDAVLEQRGYQMLDPSLVMYRSLDRPIQPDRALELQSEQLDSWLEHFCQLTEALLERHEIHRQMLQAIPAQPLFATLADGGSVVACGIGVLEHDIFGLFDIATAPQQRRRGYGSALLEGMLQWAQQRGAAHSYMQVMANNEAALQLYRKQGFEKQYDYWYRILA